MTRIFLLWLMAGADLLWENSTANWLVAGIDLVWEYSTAGWLADKPNKHSVAYSGRYQTNIDHFLKTEYMRM